ncbi:MAG: hypothetical protein ACTSP3_03795 [Candidatus Heimdallarchaeaceae archaeon]
MDTTPPTISGYGSDPRLEDLTDAISSMMLYIRTNDSSGILSVYFYYRLNNTNWNIQSFGYIQDDFYEGEIFMNFKAGHIFEFYYIVTDNSENQNSVTTDIIQTFIRSADYNPPTIHQLSHEPVNSEDNDIITITLEASDSSGIKYSTLYYKTNFTDWLGKNMTYISGDIYRTQIGLFESGYLVEYYVYLVDASLNHNNITSPLQTIKVGSSDHSGPLISNITVTPDNPNEMDLLKFQAEIFDSSGIEYVKLFYRLNGREWLYSLMEIISLSIYEVVIGPFNPEDFIEYYIEATDSSLNSNVASTIIQSLTINYSDINPPTVIQVLYEPLEPKENDLIEFWVKTSDISGISSVKILFRISYGIWNNESLQEVNSTTYTIMIGPFNSNDRIDYYFVITDASLKFNKLIYDNNGEYFTIIIDVLTTNYRFSFVSLSFIIVILVVLRRKRRE